MVTAAIVNLINPNIMKKFTEKITEIIIHCTATPHGRDIGESDVRRYHLQRGFETTGYHYVVRLDGTVETGRGEMWVGAHCLCHNSRSIGVAYVGGLGADGCPADTRTTAQRTALRGLVGELCRRYPGATVHGHCEFAAKACPCFDAACEYSSLTVRRS